MNDWSQGRSTFLLLKFLGVIALIGLAKVCVSDDATTAPQTEIVSRKLEDWRITFEFTGGTPAERRRLGWHEVTVSASGGVDVIDMIGGRESPKTWQKEHIELRPDELNELFERSRSTVNRFQVINEKQDVVWHDGQRISLRIAASRRMVELIFDEMKDYADAGEDVKKIILILNKHLKSVKKIRLSG